MNAYAHSHALEFSGPAYVIYPHDELSLSNPNQYLARVMANIS
jgi:hypothetical protein